jgi:hypothetical protein
MAPRDQITMDQITINDALEAFLAEQRGRLAAKTLRRYEDVVWLLRECLDGYGHSSLSADERRRWEKTFEGGEDAFCRLFGPEKIPAHIDEFLDWFMVRKVMASQELLKASGTVTGKLVRWLAERGYVETAPMSSRRHRVRMPREGLACPGRRRYQPAARAKPRGRCGRSTSRSIGDVPCLSSPAR